MYESSERRWSVDFQVGRDGYSGTESLESYRSETIVRASQRKAIGDVLGMLYERASIEAEEEQ